MMTRTLPLLALALACTPRPSMHAETVNEPEPVPYWSEARAGANSFSLVPSATRFGAAADLGLEFIRLSPSKWHGAGRDFLIGDADDFVGIPPADLEQLITALDDAHAAGLKVVLTMLSLPGARWRQHNEGVTDPRLWTNAHFHAQSAAFWAELASALRGHPAIAGYNPLNEPKPEVTRQADETLAQWNERSWGGPADLNELYDGLIRAIRGADPDVVIVLDVGNDASPEAITRLRPIRDPHVLYSVHLYEPWEYTTWRRNRGETSYPNENWNRATLETALSPLVDWQREHNISSTNIMLGEFGCDRRIPGVEHYLADTVSLAEEAGWHWAFYSFREDDWDGMDYELGSQPLSQSEREARERGEAVTRDDHPALDALRAGIQRQRARQGGRGR